MTLRLPVVTPPSGPDGAPLLLLGSSLGTSSILWEKAAPVLRRTFRTACIDLPGHGTAAPATEAFSVGDLADAVVATADELDAATFLYAGVSLGGAIGLELLLRHPERVEAGAIVASGARLGDPEQWLARAELVRGQSTSVLISASAARWFGPDSMAREPELSGRLLHALQDADDESYALCCEALAAYDVRDALDHVDAPVLTLWGEHDTVAPESLAREIADGVRRGRSIRIDGVGHLPPAERPLDVAAILSAFLSIRPERIA